MPNIATLHIDDFQRVINNLNNQGELAIIYFSASWCQPCKRMAPVFERISIHFNDANIFFGSIDIAEAPIIAQQYGIKSVPTVAILQKGRLIVSLSGERPFEEFIRHIEIATSSLRDVLVNVT
ncbi:thioredoxin family protein [Comamonas thiooxydans]|uniref:thioredoxin family protein n=1 Tax=Comamonas thiooxydans TaxID=363952 RepID=UPI000B35BC24|nr:thioredoxin family protein [Comamonas thiooxydans]BDR08995.1 thioredoxin family protein [Comamonas thiooxydans]